jgi:hypothetical protein
MQRGRAPDTKNDDGSGKGLPQRIRALERTLQHVTSMIGDNGLPELVITGANLRIVNGLGRTACLEGETFPGCPNGLGNLIVGYNEPPEPGSGDAVRTGSHNIVVGQELNYSGFGGLVVGFSNTISGGFASVSGGFENIANGGSSVSGGSFNTAAGGSVSGGRGNTASGFNSSVSGGTGNTASIRKRGAGEHRERRILISQRRAQPTSVWRVQLGGWFVVRGRFRVPDI